jgi:hypothetical protein
MILLNKFNYLARITAAFRNMLLKTLAVLVQFFLIEGLTHVKVRADFAIDSSGSHSFNQRRSLKTRGVRETRFHPKTVKWTDQMRNSV